MRRAIAISMLLAAVCAAADRPETVMLRFQAKPGAEEELAKVIARHWKTVRELKLVQGAPHVTLRGTEDGKTYFVDIFTWRDAGIPDAAPPTIQAIWGEMNKLVEARGGKPGIQIAEVSVETAPNE
jgi:hypothetical protein